MSTVAFIAAASLIVLFGLLCIKTADAINIYRAHRKSEAASLTKRQHEAMVATVSNIVREAILLGRKK